MTTTTTLDPNEHKDDWEEDEDDSSFWSDVKETWRQHCIAILLALLATAVAYRYNHNTIPTTRVSHIHLESYERTSHLSFCKSLTNKNHLSVMDFTVPPTLQKSMIRHFAADILQDDHYQQVLLDNNDVSTYKQHQQVQCIQQQNDTIKGFTYYYKTPSFESMVSHPAAEQPQPPLAVMNHKPQKKAPAYLTFTGFGAKFINLSNQPVLLYWNEQKLVGEIPPFQAIGTATTPGQSFSVTPVYDSSTHLQRWTVTADDPILYYEPQLELSYQEQALYELQKLNQQFARDYLIHAKRPWLANFPRPPPMHYMYPADYLGQQHILSNYTLSVASVTPRVFTIPNFATAHECQQLIQMARTRGFTQSTLYSGSSQQRDGNTRSSTNTWLARQTTQLTDDIYQRAAHLLQIDQGLLNNEFDEDLPAHQHGLAESLQVVSYKRNQQYTAHHDYVFSSTTHRHQPTRFATLLLYLNDNYEGGQTQFPRAVNPHHHDGITIQPKQGMAVLFYNMLPDGNVDDWSQHASRPVESGEKFLANLWVWDPVIH